MDHEAFQRKLETVVTWTADVKALKERLQIIGHRVLGLDGPGGTFYCWAHPAGGFMCYDTASGELDWYANIKDQLVEE